MNYKVLYRKYRPTTFDDVIGQDYIISMLKNSISNNKISHAYIFSGPRGTGKTSTAKIFAKTINCLNSFNGIPCNNCEFCANYNDNPDIIEIDAASNNGVDEIRSLIDNIKLTPSNGKYKVYIIDEVHMLTTSAFNALLLTLEEPPSHAIFILATTNIENVPITILSRCQRFDFKKITVDDIVRGLKNVCEQEKINYDEDALKEIAYLSEGGMRDALSLLDQLSKNNEKITLTLVENQIKTISQKGINDLIKAIENNKVENVLKILSEYEKRSIDFKTLIKKIIDTASQKVKQIKTTGKYERLNFDDYKKLILNLSECLVKINVNVNPYTILEVIILDTMEIENIMQERVEKNTFQVDVDLKAEKNLIDDSIVEKRINNCFVHAQKSYLENIKEKLNNFENTLMTDGKIRSLIMDSHVVAASDEYLIFSCINDHVANTANNYLHDVEESLNRELNLNYKVVFISENKWTEEKEKYISNIKANRKYTLIPENEESSNELEVNSVFDVDKVEII